MKHLFKVPLNLADLFIEEITEEEIVYEVRDKITGELMEPRRTTKYVINEVDNRVYFDNRFINLQLLTQIYSTLFTETESSRTVNTANS